MKRTPITDHVDADVMLTPIDIGFDPRVLGMQVELPDAFHSATIEQNGTSYLIEGERAELVDAIRSAGYVIEQRGE